MERSIEKRSVLSGAAWLTLSAIFVKFMGLMYKIPLAYILTDEGMGYFNAAYTIYSVLYLLGSAGVPKALTVLISGCVTEQAKERRKIFRIACRFFLLLGGILFLMLFIFAVPLSRLIGSPDAYPTILLIAPCLLFVSLGGVYRGYLTAIGDFATTAASSVIEASSKLIFGLFFVWIANALKLTLPWVCAFSVLGIGVGTLGSTFYLKKHIKMNISDNKTEQYTKTEWRKTIKQVMQIALPITLGSLAVGMSSVIDLSMIMKRLEACGFSVEQATAVYGNYTSLAVPMLQLVTALLAPITVALLPRLAMAWAQGDRREYISVIRLGGKMGAFFSAPMAFAFFFFPGALLSMLFPASSAAIAAPLLRLLAPGVILVSALFIMNSALEASGGARFQMISMVIGVLFKIPISYFLLGNIKYGISGAPIGTVVSYAVSLAFSYICFRRICARPSGLLSSFRLPILNATLSVLFVFLFQGLLRFYPAGRIGSMILLFIFGVSYILFSYLTGVLQTGKIKSVAKGTNKIM